MKGKRYHRIKSTLQFYKVNFGFQAPYNVLLDGTFCRAALDAHVDVEKQLLSYFQYEAKIITTQCIILEVEGLLKLVKNLYGVYQIVKKFPIHDCGHQNKNLSAAQCIKSLLSTNNPLSYVLASVDKRLQEYIQKKVVGVPVVFLHNKTPTIEKPSAKSLKHIQDKFENREKKDIKAAHILSGTTIEEEETETQEKAVIEAQEKVKKQKTKNKKNKIKRLKVAKSTKILAKQETPVINAASSRKAKRKNKQKDINQLISKAFNIG